MTLEEGKKLLEKRVKAGDVELKPIYDAVRTDNPEVDRIFARAIEDCTGIGDLGFRLATINPAMFKMVSLVGVEETYNLVKEGRDG